MLVSIIIPAYNEEKNIQENLDAILSFVARKPWQSEILVINDGSLDQTAQKVEELSKKNPSIQCISYHPNGGKGKAVRTGMLAAKGDICGFTDADGATPIGELEKIVAMMQKEDDLDIIVGSRAKFSQETQVQALAHRKLIGRIFNFLLRMIVSVYDRKGQLIQDTQCGFKWFRKEAAQRVFSKSKIMGFAFDVEALYLANRLQMRIEEMPVNWIEKGDSKVNLLVDPLKMFWQVITIRFLHWWT